MAPTKEPLATRKNAMLSLAAFLVICTAWWYAQQPASPPPPPPPPGDTTIVVQPPDTTTPPVACSLTGGSGNIGSSTCQPCAFIPPGPNTASVDPSCVQPPDLSCKLIGGSGDTGSGTCQPCPYNPPGAGYATTATECVAPPPPQQCTLLYGTGTPGSSTCQPCPYNPPGQSFATQAPTCVAPIPPDTTPQPTGKIGPATIAELPRTSLTYSYPSGLAQIIVPVGGNLQTAINNAAPGSEILLAPGGTWVGNFTLPNKGSNSWVVIRTNTTNTTGRMTPTKSATNTLAKVCSNNTSPAIGTLPSANHYWITGLEICGQAGANGMNILVRFGDSPGNGHTSLSVTPHDLVLDRNWIHVLPTNNVRRCVLANAYRVWIVRNWIEECHDSGGDSQAILGYNGAQQIQIEDNTLIAGHEIIMSGGADAADSTLQPSDWRLIKNHIYRPAAYKGVWPEKNLIETKNIRRYLIEYNVIENDWSDGQQFAFNFKTENQNGTNPWATSADITMQYNLINNIGSGWNFSGMQGAVPGITAARYYVHDNWVKSGWQVSPYLSTGNVTQTLTGLQDLIFAHNTINNPITTNAVDNMDQPAQVRMAWHSNVFYHGTYGMKGAGQSAGTNSINTYAPGALFANNVFVALPGGTSCSQYPVSTVCPATWPTTGIAGYDGRAAGADTVKIKTGTAGVVVSPGFSGIPVLPGQSLQVAVDAAPAGSTFLLSAGTYLGQTVIPKDNDQFRGAGSSTILDGQNSTTFAFKGYTGSRWVNGVGIHNLVITRYASPTQNGAIYGGDDLTNATSGWVLDSLEVSNSANLAVRIGNRMQVLRSNLHHNGTINIGGIGQSVVIDSVEAAYGNNGCPNNPGFESGGSKFVRTDSLIVRNSFFHHNCGPGLWLDIDNIHYVLENNRVEDNYREGIVTEISYAGVIRNNSVKRNGYLVDPFRTQNWLWDAGIAVHASSDVEIYGNTLDSNFNGIVAIQQNRGAAYGDPAELYGPYLVQNLYVHDNTVTQNIPQGGGLTNAAAGIVTDVVGGSAIFTSRNNRYTHNTYFLLPLGGGQSPGFEWQGWKDDTQWKALGNDLTGTFSR